MKKILPRHASRSFALISVLALVSLAALTATAFLASARLERAATRSIGSQTQLDMSLQAGAEMARFLIDNAFQDNYVPAIVTCFRSNLTNDLGYLWLGKPTNNATVAPTVLFYPVFSHAGVTNLTLDGTAPFSCTNVSVAHQGVFSSTVSIAMGVLTSGYGTLALGPTYVRIPLVSASNATPNDQDWSPAVGWITLRAKAHPTNTSNTPYARVAFFVQDMSGLVDAERMGSATNRSTGTNSEEISLTNVFGTSLINPSTVQNLTNNRRFFLSPGLLRQAAGLNTNDLRYVASGLRSSLVWSNLVPYGVAISSGSGYPAAGSSRQALNTNSAGAITVFTDVPVLANWIGSNLPAMSTTRAGGFISSAGGGATNPAAYTTNAYLQTLAASIVDYADTDSTPTTDGTAMSTNRTRPTYRGVDSHPFINEYVTRFNLFSTNTTNVGSVNGQAIIIQTTDYVELWNPCNRTNSGLLTFAAINRQPFTAGFSSFNFTNPLWATNAAGGQVAEGVSSNSTNITLQPNEFLVIGFPTVTNFFFYPNTNLTLPLNLSDDINSSYRVAWNSVYYDGALGGLRRQSKTLSAINGPKWSGTCPGFVGENLSSSTFWNMSGDPRASIYQSPPQSAISYDTRSSFGGRNYRNGLTGFPYGEVKPSLWPDGGQDSPPGNLPSGGVNTLPTSVSPATYTNCPPVRISNAGFFSNVCELGNIFDPMQWFDANGKASSSGYGNDGGQWTNLTTTAVASNAYGGGASLRIGRWEYARFAFTNFGGTGSIPSPAMGVANASLLDIFTLSNSPVDNGGKINLNTAPGPVLAALAGGCRLTNDPALLPGGTNFSIPAGMATNAFALGVQRFRARYPFYSPSQLGFISASASSPTDWPQGAVFGNTNSITNSITGIATSMGITAWSDRAAEEWFAKIFGLSSTTSFNFRVYVVAQLLDAKGQPTSSFERRLYHIYCDYNSSGQLSTKQAGEYLY